MRTIKFRAWCTNLDNISFSNGDHMEYDITLVEGKYASVESGWDIHGTYDFPIMQYTGLKDKKGKEIYEGDIVNEGIDDMNYEVVFTQGGFWLDERDNETGWPDSGDIEIIGNIYENPELLAN